MLSVVATNNYLFTLSDMGSAASYEQARSQAAGCVALIPGEYRNRFKLTIFKLNEYDSWEWSVILKATS